MTTGPGAATPSAWPARFAGLKAALHLVIGGVVWIFGALVLSNGFNDSYGGTALAAPLLSLALGLVVVPWAVIRSVRKQQAASSPHAATRRALWRCLAAFWLLHMLASCSVMLTAGACQEQGLKAPPACRWLKSP